MRPIVNNRFLNCQLNWQNLASIEKKNYHLDKKFNNLSINVPFTIDSVIEVTNSSTLPTEIRTNSSIVDGEQGNITRIQKFRNWKNSLAERFRKRLSSMKCFNWPRFKNQRKKHIQRPTTARDVPKKNIFTRFKAAFCRFVFLKLKNIIFQYIELIFFFLRSFRWKSKIAPAESTNCCRKEGGCCSFLCKKPNWCKWPSCCKSCCSCSCCQRDETRSERSRSIRAKHSLTSVAPPPIVEVNLKT